MIQKGRKNTKTPQVKIVNNTLFNRGGNVDVMIRKVLSNEEDGNKFLLKLIEEFETTLFSIEDGRIRVIPRKLPRVATDIKLVVTECLKEIKASDDSKAIEEANAIVSRIYCRLDALTK
jgi:hypothetical protein